MCALFLLSSSLFLSFLISCAFCPRKEAAASLLLLLLILLLASCNTFPRLHLLPLLLCVEWLLALSLTHSLAKFVKETLSVPLCHSLNPPASLSFFFSSSFFLLFVSFLLPFCLSRLLRPRYSREMSTVLLKYRQMLSRCDFLSLSFFSSLFVAIFSAQLHCLFTLFSSILYLHASLSLAHSLMCDAHHTNHLSFSPPLFFSSFHLIIHKRLLHELLNYLLVKFVLSTFCLPPFLFLSVCLFHLIIF